MENTLIGPESGRMERFHLVHFLDSLLDIPGAAWDVDLLIYLFCSSKKGSEVRAAHRRKISDLGFLSDLARVVVSGPRRMVTSSNAGAGCAAARNSPVLERVQRRHDALQCGYLVSLRRFHSGAKQTKTSDSDHDQGDAQHRANPRQTGWVTAGFWSRLVTKRVRLVESAFRLGSKSVDAHDVGEVTPTALVPFASLVAENQQASMRKTSKLAAGWC
ncbi:hypothetical protein JVX91_03020 [Pseudomonas sp. PDNC002]|uniref:hypothetical protein n=1 Tax=Pseudomonas sp. PDNC002 TaxID=2811422 RepID=UPI0019656A8E|nr:hypothetical protein [Pseudomonas sp. PDNC002]QRY80109.1 hypothetical protein JVX91_03020 [Pseudomonas sp. PDNC002]